MDIPESAGNKVLNFEFRAHCHDPEKIKHLLKSINAEYIGNEEQYNTYFNVKVGRLKLQESSKGRDLIHYDKNSSSGIGSTNVLLHIYNPEESLKEVLTNSIGVKAQVKKVRDSWRKDFASIYIDSVEGIGLFVTVEVKDDNGYLSPEQLQEICQQFITLLEIQQQDFVGKSYDDMLL
jgi:predicted adenylyl cyclase CyaB